MKILWMIRSLDPKDGGPVAALRQAALALQDLGQPSDVLTLDAPDAPWVREFPGVVHALGPGRGQFGYTSRVIPWLQKNAVNYDAVIVRGIWEFPGAAAWLAAKKARFPYFVFTHGMLDPWFKTAYPLKHIKKSIYWFLLGYPMLRDAKAVFFTSQEEKEMAPVTFNMDHVNGIVVDYGIGSPEGDPQAQVRSFLDTYPSLRGKRLVLFLSRIHVKKGCDLLIDAFSQVARQDPNLHLVMAGPDEQGWIPQLKQRCSLLGIEDQVTWTGMLDGNLKWGAFHAADVFILPSHGENFGVVIAEALACGLPVLTTDKVNIWRDIIQDGAGMVEPDTSEGIVSLLQRWEQLSQPERQTLRANALKCFSKRYDVKMTTKKFLETLLPFLDGGIAAVPQREDQQLHA
jgi:glycosyltransferase involved in cell wall biosynthesis